MTYKEWRRTIGVAETVGDDGMMKEDVGMMQQGKQEMQHELESHCDEESGTRE